MNLRMCHCAVAALTCMVASIALAPRDAKGAIEPDAQAKVKEVLSGQRSEANAAWWGFNAEDSTQALQAAINSGAKKLIVPNMGKDWIVDQIKLASNQEIVFEPGVVVSAKKGAFQEVRDALFTAEAKENITLRGPGATLKMHKADYQNPKLYKPSEWRHLLNLLSCSNVKIYGLTLQGSGGDGIYLGRHMQRQSPTFCKNVHIKDVVCDDNHRQGISVISAKDLLIEDCVLKNTGGTEPQAGIDLEPNRVDEQMTNVVIRNCLAQNNRGAGFEVAMTQFTAQTPDVSILFENCRVENSGKYGLSVQCRSQDESNAGGLLEFRNCSVDGSAHAGMYIKNKAADKAYQVKFTNCTLKNSANEKTSQSPIWFLAQKISPARQGGVVFENCRISDAFERPFALLKDERGDTTIANVNGTIQLLNPFGGSLQLGPRLVDSELKVERKAEPGAILMGMTLNPVAATGLLAPETRVPSARVKGPATYVLWGEQGKVVRFRLQCPADVSNTKVRVFDAAGTVVKEVAINGGPAAPVEFDAPATGPYVVACNPDGKPWEVRAPGACAILAQNHRVNLMKPQVTLYFSIPAGVQDSQVKVAGQDTAELVDAAILDAAGKVVEKQEAISGARPHTFAIHRSDVSKAEVWAIKLDKPAPTKGGFEDVFVELSASLPPVLASDPARLLVPVKTAQ